MTRGRSSRLLIFLLLGAALSAGLVAATVLPDQTWMSGLYDAADEDAVLLLVWDQTVPIVDVSVVTHQSVSIALVLPLAPWLAASPGTTADSRSPPLS